MQPGGKRTGISGAGQQHCASHSQPPGSGCGVIIRVCRWYERTDSRRSSFTTGQPCVVQTRGGLATGSVKAAARGGGLVESFLAIGRQEGLTGYWRGNIPQVFLLSD